VKRDPATVEAASRWLRGVLQPFTGIMRARFDEEVRLLPSGHELEIHDGGEPTTEPARELRLLAAFLDAQASGVEGILPLYPAPIFPTDARSRDQWDLYWFSKLYDVDGLSAVGHRDRTLEDGIADLWPESAERWLRAGVRTVLLAGNGVSLEPRHLAAMGFDCTALDLSPLATTIALYLPDRPEYLAIYLSHGTGADPTAFDHLRRAGGRARYVCGDLADPAVLPGPYDLVITRRTLQCTAPDHLQMLDAVLARLRPGGQLHLQEHNARGRTDGYLAHLAARGRRPVDARVGDGDTELVMSSG
jgi:hypothetical protein